MHRGSTLKGGGEENLQSALNTLSHLKRVLYRWAKRA